MFALPMTAMRGVLGMRNSVDEMKAEFIQATLRLSTSRHLVKRVSHEKIVAVEVTMRSLRLRCPKKPLLTIERSKKIGTKMVYILAADRAQSYKNGRSFVVYIGTTGKGAKRPAASAVDKASQAFGVLHGVKTIRVHTVTCNSRKAMKTWLHLESALLSTFRNLYFELPTYNRKGGLRKHAQDRLFRRSALEKLILRFAP